MKRPEYVAAAVTACRQALAKEPYDLAALEAVFSRGGFTDGYLAGKRNLSMFGVRGHEDVQASQRVQGQLAGLYRHERPAVPVDMTLTLAAETPSTLTVTDGVHAVEATGDIPQIAQMAPTDEPRARRSLSKTGESPFTLRILTLQMDGTLMLPASALNAMRRDALSSLLSLREAPQPKAFVDAPLPQFPPHVAAESPALHLRLQSAQQLWDGMDAARIMLPVEEITPELLAQYEGRLVGELPALLFPAYTATVNGLLSQLKDSGLSGVLCHNIGAIEMARGHGLTIHGGYGLNILNTAALTAYAGLGLADATVSFELSAQKLRRLGGTMARGAIAYGYLPLMQLRCCPAQQAGGCGTCDGHPTLTDRKGIRFPLLCEHKRYVTLLNSVLLNLSGEPLPGVDFHTLYFTNETAAECRRITDDFIDHTPPTGERTRGLYFRTLQ